MKFIILMIFVLSVNAELLRPESLESFKENGENKYVPVVYNCTELKDRISKPVFGEFGYIYFKDTTSNKYYVLRVTGEVNVFNDNEWVDIPVVNSGKFSHNKDYYIYSDCYGNHVIFISNISNERLEFSLHKLNFFIIKDRDIKKKMTILSSTQIKPKTCQEYNKLIKSIKNDIQIFYLGLSHEKFKDLIYFVGNKKGDVLRLLTSKESLDTSIFFNDKDIFSYKECKENTLIFEVDKHDKLNRYELFELPLNGLMVKSYLEGRKALDMYPETKLKKIGGTHIKVSQDNEGLEMSKISSGAYESVNDGDSPEGGEMEEYVNKTFKFLRPFKNCEEFENHAKLIDENKRNVLQFKYMGDEYLVDKLDRLLFIKQLPPTDGTHGSKPYWIKSDLAHFFKYVECYESVFKKNKNSWLKFESTVGESQTMSIPLQDIYFLN